MTGTAEKINELASELTLRYPHLPIERIWRLVCEQNPSLAERHHLGASAGEPPPGQSETVVEQGTATMTDGQRRHYSTLSEPERKRWYPGAAR